LGGAGRRQQTFAEQADFSGIGRVGEFLQVRGGLGLQIALQGAGGREVEAVEIVQRPVEHARQTTASGADALVGFDGLDGRLGLPVAVADLAGEGGIGQGAVDHSVLLEQTQMAVGEVGEFLAALGQIIRRAALGDHQREHLAQGQAFFGHGFGSVPGLLNCSLALLKSLPYQTRKPSAMPCTSPCPGTADSGTLLR
jgi:hypothetical protein